MIKSHTRNLFLPEDIGLRPIDPTLGDDFDIELSTPASFRLIVLTDEQISKL
jgi:hypothetical protein